MNRDYKHYPGELLPKCIDSIHESEDGYMIEYGGWHFEAKTLKGTINQVLRFIFKGGDEQ